MDRQIFLARNGKTEGPYTEEQLTELTDSGELYRYEWIWDGNSPDWQPVPRRAKAPPPRPEVTITRIDAPSASFAADHEAEVVDEDEVEDGPAPKREEPVAKSKSAKSPGSSSPSSSSKGGGEKSTTLAKAPKTRTAPEGKRFSAILYDHEKAFSGKVWKRNDTSAKFLTGSSHHPFKMGQVVWVDLLHEEKDQAFKVRGAIEAIQHSAEGWEMTLILDAFPAV